MAENTYSNAQLAAALAKNVIPNDTGDPIKSTTQNEIYSPGRTALDKNADLRDRLAELVSLGNSIKPDDKASIFSDLKKMLGEPVAQKVMEHAFIFNSRPDVLKLPVEEKIKSFYNIGSRDTDVQGILNTTKALGQGVIPGFRSSSSNINQQQSSGNAIAPIVDPNLEIRKTIANKIAAK
ncbi:MAG: hypothetical protein AABY22_19230 [Nanoarchaeota archaeon]